MNEIMTVDIQPKLLLKKLKCTHLRKTSELWLWFLKLYGIKKEHLRLENVLIPDSDGIVRNVSGGQQLSEGILDTFKVISDLNKGIITNWYLY